MERDSWQEIPDLRKDGGPMIYAPGVVVRRHGVSRVGVELIVQPAPWYLRWVTLDEIHAAHTMWAQVAFEHAVRRVRMGR